MENVRDVVLIVTGIVWSVVWLAILVIVLVLFSFAQKGLNSAHNFLRQSVAPVMLQVQAQAELVRGKTAQLAGHPLPDGMVPRKSETTGFRFSLPRFGRRKRSWWQRVLDR